MYVYIMHVYVVIYVVYSRTRQVRPSRMRYDDMMYAHLECLERGYIHTHVTPTRRVYTVRSGTHYTLASIIL